MNQNNMPSDNPERLQYGVLEFYQRLSVFIGG